MQDATLYRDQSDLWLKVAESISHKVGHEFLEGLVSALRDRVQADLVFIAVREDPEKPEVRAIWTLEDGAPSDGFSYELEGTPCAVVYGGQEMLIPCDLAEMFPKEEGYHGYIGAPLHGESGEVEGHLAILSREPIPECPMAMPLVRIFALRIAAERRRDRLENDRRLLQTELEKVNQGLRSSYQAVHAANAFKTRLLSVIAHDLRNPLAAIMCQAELAGRLAELPEPCPEKIGKAGAKAACSAERMGDMIRATLDRLREESEGRSVKREKADLCALLRLAVEANARAAAEKSIHVSVEKPERLMATVDEARLLEAIDNLIDNAIKFSPDDASIVVSLAAAGSNVRIAVADNGRGLSSADVRRAFGWLETNPAQQTGDAAGAGVGLSIVKEVAEAHGGGVEVKSAGPGQGSTFTIVLPVGEVV